LAAKILGGHLARALFCEELVTSRLKLQKRIGKFGVVFALAVEPYPSEKSWTEFVSWDDEIHSQLNGKN